MGRFQYHEDDEEEEEEDTDENDNGAPSNPHHRDWHFIASPGEEGALVASYAHDSQNPLPEHSGRIFHDEQDCPPDQRRTIFVVYQNGSGELYDCDGRHGHDDIRDHRSMCCPLWLKITVLAFLCNLVWYGWQEGPPAPPMLSVGQEDTDSSSAETLVTWNDYLHNHTRDFLTSGMALFINLPYHVISWWSVHVHSDFYGMYERWNKPRPCSLEWNGSQSHDEIEERLSACFTAQSQRLAVQKLTEALQAWSWDIRVRRPRPLVLLASSMTPGLEPDGLGECLIRRILYPSCTRNRNSLSERLDMRRMMDIPRLRNKLIETLTPWQGQGGLVILTSVDNLPHDTLEWLLQTLTGDIHDDNVDEADRFWMQSLAQRAIFLLTSDEIGRSSLIRHTRESEKRIASLMLDLRHDWQMHGAEWKSGAAVLPFFAITQEQVQLFASLRLREILHNWKVLFVDGLEIGETLIPTSLGMNIFVEQKVIEVVTGPDVVEYVAWSADFGGQEVYIMTFSSAGVQPAEEKLQWLVGRVGMCVGDGMNSQSILLVLKYEDETSRLLLQRCHSPVVTSCTGVCSFPLV